MARARAAVRIGFFMSGFLRLGCDGPVTSCGARSRRWRNAPIACDKNHKRRMTSPAGRSLHPLDKPDSVQGKKPGLAKLTRRRCFRQRPEEVFGKTVEEGLLGGAAGALLRGLPLARESRVAPPRLVGGLARQPSAHAGPGDRMTGGERFEEQPLARARPAVVAGRPIRANGTGGGVGGGRHDPLRLLRTKSESGLLNTKARVGKRFLGAAASGGGAPSTVWERPLHRPAGGPPPPLRGR